MNMLISFLRVACKGMPAFTRYLDRYEYRGDHRLCGRGRSRGIGQVVAVAR